MHLHDGVDKHIAKACEKAHYANTLDKTTLYTKCKHRMETRQGNALDKAQTQNVDKHDAQSMLVCEH